MTSPPHWTAELVGQRLIDAFKRLPSRPVMSHAKGFMLDGEECRPFAWPDRFVSELRDRRLVTVWASCRASGDSLAGWLRDLGWPKQTSERRRRKALAMIAAGLNAAGEVDGFA